MSDLNREQFEKWFEESGFKKFKETAWGAWQASRECLVIDLPKPTGMDRMSSEMSMQEIREDNRFNRALELAKKALTAAGVKTK